MLYVLAMKAAAYDKLEKTITLISELHSPTQDGRSCIECSRIACSVTSTGLGSIQYPCVTAMTLGAFDEE